MPHVSGLFYYPVKSLRGCPASTLPVDALGPVGDRRFLVVDPTGRFLTQRTHPRLARIATALDAGTLTLSADGAGSLAVPRASDPAAPRLPVSVWKSEGLLAEDCGAPAAGWLSDFLGTPGRLVRIGDQFHRPVKPTRARPGDLVSFADGYPFLLISEASLAALNDRLQENGAEPVPLDRFRPNLVVAGCPPFAEDGWSRFRLGDVGFRHAGPCARCVVPTIDQHTGERTGPEPLRTLATFRRDATNPADVNFGVNLIHETKQGTLRLGDTLELL